MKPMRFLSLKVVLPFLYRVWSRRAVDETKCVFVEVSAEHLTDSFALLYERFSKDYQCRISFLHNGFVSGLSYLKNCIVLMKEIADAKFIFINEASNVLNTIPLRKETKLIQTWHGCGAFKKFGFSTASLGWGVSEKEMKAYPYYKNQSLVTVSGEACIPAYKDAMRQDETVIKALGVSRTDVYFDETRLRAARDTIFAGWSAAAGKKLVLFAPTFRGTQGDAHAVSLDLNFAKRLLADRFVLAVKHHPFVREREQIPAECADFARDLSDMPIETLLMAADICVTDYSSLIFEYALLLRPMVFYAPDLPGYYDERGFYAPYRKLVPGEICEDEEELYYALREADKTFDKEQIRDFRDRYMSACDGHATERIYRHVVAM